MKVNCLPVYVYRNNVIGDCTNDGISKYFKELLVYCPDGHITFDSDECTPLNFCIVDSMRGQKYIVPACIDEYGICARPGWWMNGGNIASTSDSRFSHLTGHYYPLKIHDRKE